MAQTTANPLSTAASTLNALDFQLALTAGNLSLKNVAAANPFRAELSISSVENITPAGASSGTGTNFPIGTDVVKAISVIGTQRMISQGPPVDSKNPLDVMIQGQGMVEIEFAGSPTGKAYIRGLQLKKGPDGRLLTKEGYVVSPGILIPIDADQVTLSPNGEWSALLPGQSAPSVLGQMTIVRFQNPAGLMPKDKDIYLQTAASGAPEPGIAGANNFGSFQQFAYEASTIDSSSELIRLVELSKDYAYVVKIIERWDEATKMVAQAA